MLRRISSLKWRVWNKKKIYLHIKDSGVTLWRIFSPQKSKAVDASTQIREKFPLYEVVPMPFLIRLQCDIEDVTAFESNCRLQFLPFLFSTNIWSQSVHRCTRFTAKSRLEIYILPLPAQWYQIFFTRHESSDNSPRLLTFIWSMRSF